MKILPRSFDSCEVFLHKFSRLLEIYSISGIENLFFLFLISSGRQKARKDFGRRRCELIKKTVLSKFKSFLKTFSLFVESRKSLESLEFGFDGRSLNSLTAHFTFIRLRRERI